MPGSGGAPAGQQSSPAFCKLKDMYVVSRIMTEIEFGIGVVDKRLAEFVLKVARSSKTVDEFE